MINPKRNRVVAHIATFALGLVVGTGTETAAALLLYTDRGFLGTAGFLIALTLASLALGLWVGSESVSPRRRWVAVVVAYGLAAVFAVLWMGDAGFRKAAFGSALAVFFLLAEPAYTAAAVYHATARKDGAVLAFAGAALGVLLAALYLIPRFQPGVIFLLAAVVLFVVMLLLAPQLSNSMRSDGSSLNGKAAVVTGVGDRGQVGYAVAQRLALMGVRVCVTSRRADIETLANELGAVGVACDLRNEDDVARLMATARERLGGIDILVNTAGGLSVIKPLGETSVEEWRQELERNADTAFVVNRAALPALRESKGVIINFASPAADKPVRNLSAYSAAKAAVVALTRAIALEEKGNGVRANAIAPGMIDTAQNRAAVTDPGQKWVTREQIADAVVFLVTSGINGEILHV